MQFLLQAFLCCTYVQVLSIIPVAASQDKYGLVTQNNDNPTDLEENANLDQNPGRGLVLLEGWGCCCSGKNCGANGGKCFGCCLTRSPNFKGPPPWIAAADKIISENYKLPTCCLETTLAACTQFKTELCFVTNTSLHLKGPSH
jgi:hypothetical protein